MELATFLQKRNPGMMKVGRTFLAAIIFLTFQSTYAPAEWLRFGSDSSVFAIDPSMPTATDVIKLSHPLDRRVYRNACEARRFFGDPSLVLDEARRTAEIRLGTPDPFAVCTTDYNPVSGLTGEFGPLAEGHWSLNGPYGNRLDFAVKPESLRFVRQPGDANEDRIFNAADIRQVLDAAKYETQRPANWTEGDWNGAPNPDIIDAPPRGDGFFNSNDVVAALGTGLYEAGPYAAIADGITKVNNVPEPSTFVLTTFGFIFLLTFDRRRRNGGSAWRCCVTLA